MNRARRAQIRQILLDLKEAIDRADERLGDVQDEEQDAFDNLPDSLQCGEKGEAIENAITELEELRDVIQSHPWDWDTNLEWLGVEL